MGEQNQSVMLNTLKRKLSANNVQGSDFQKRKTHITDSEQLSAFTLIETFLNTEQSKGELKIHNQHFQLQWWQREHLLLQFLTLVVKIIAQVGVEDPLKNVLQDIVALGVDILGLEQPVPDEKIYTTIVTSALEVSKGHEVHPDDKDGVVKVEPKPKKGLNSKVIDFAVKLLVKFLYPNLQKSCYLEHNFAPIREETSPTSDLIVKGEIPMDLNGMMIRNGPDPTFDPVAFYAWLDGDSMLHGVRFKEGKATYVARYVQTSRFKQEQFFKESEFLQYGDLEGKFGLLMSCVQLLKAKLGVLDMSYGWLNANVHLMYHDGRLMALQDFDKPYVLNISQNGDLKTRGINDYKKRLANSMLPHPKKDPITGELFVLSGSYTPPYTIYSIATKEGVMNNPLPITVSGPTYMHDFGITQNYVIFMDLPYCYDPENMVNNHDWIYMLDIRKKSRFGVLPKYATSEEKIKWFEFDSAFFIFHNGNSWEEDDDTIVLISCLMKPKLLPSTYASTSLMAPEIPKKSKLFFSPANVYNGPRRRLLNPAHVSKGPSGQGVQTFSSPDIDIDENCNNDLLEYVEVTLPTLYKFTFNMKTGEATKNELFETTCDYPNINKSYMGRKSRYVYTSEFNKEIKMPAIVKNDLQWKTELKLYLGENKCGSEAIFSPRQSPSKEEDDGYLTTFVQDEENHVSYTYVVDAKKMELLAMIELANRVPYGFHATYVTEDELQDQKPI